MTPHAIVFLTALSIAFLGKMAFPGFTLRIVGIGTVALPVGVSIYLREVPSPLGLLIAVPISVAGALAGVALASIVLQRRRRGQRSR